MPLPPFSSIFLFALRSPAAVFCSLCRPFGSISRVSRRHRRRNVLPLAEPISEVVDNLLPPTPRRRRCVYMCALNARGGAPAAATRQFRMNFRIFGDIYVWRFRYRLCETSAQARPARTRKPRAYTLGIGERRRVSVKRANSLFFYAGWRPRFVFRRFFRDAPFKSQYSAHRSRATASLRARCVYQVSFRLYLCILGDSIYIYICENMEMMCPYVLAD